MTRSASSKTARPRAGRPRRGRGPCSRTGCPVRGRGRRSFRRRGPLPRKIPCAGEGRPGRLARPAASAFCAFPQLLDEAPPPSRSRSTRRSRGGEDAGPGARRPAGRCPSFTRAMQGVELAPRGPPAGCAPSASDAAQGRLSGRAAGAAAAATGARERRHGDLRRRCPSPSASPGRAPRARRGSSSRRSRRPRRRSAAASRSPASTRAGSWFEAERRRREVDVRVRRLGVQRRREHLLVHARRRPSGGPAAPAPAFRWPMLLLAEPSAIEPLRPRPRRPSRGSPPRRRRRPSCSCRAPRRGVPVAGSSPASSHARCDRELLADRVRRGDALALAVARRRRCRARRA